MSVLAWVADYRHWAVTGIVILAVFSYASTLSLQFFWEDPFDIGQVEHVSYWQALFTPISNSYYRPLTMLVFKVLRASSVGHLVWTYHLPIVGAHVVAAVLCLKLAQALFGRIDLAVIGAGLFAIYPISYEAVARATAPHTWALALALGALLLHVHGREQTHGQYWHKLVWAQVLAIMAIGVHENGVLIAPMLVLVELYLFSRKRIARLSRWVLMAFVPVLTFIIIWLNIPKPIVDAVQVRPGLLEFAYVSQGLSFPLAHLISQLGGLGLSAQTQALVAFGLTLLFLGVGSWRRHKLEIALCLSLWLLSVSLAWLTRSMGYLETSSRVLYFGSFAAAWAWVMSLWPDTNHWSWNLEPVMVEKVPMSYLRFGLTGLLLLQSAWVLGKQVQLYQAGSTLMTQIIEAGQDKNGRRKLFLNVPDRFEYRHAFYPLGYWGMLLAPVSQDLGDFIWLASPFRPRTETRSLTTRPLIDKAIKASPFEVNTRGVEAYDQGKLMDSVMWADQTYVTDYHPDGALTLQSVGEIRAKPTSPAFLARPKQVVGTIQNIATLINATVTWQPNIATISLTWQAIAPAQPTDTIFVHLIDADGQVVAQADGDSLNGLIRPSAWQPGQLIIDQRQIQLNGIPTRGLQVRVGMYSRESGQRYAALLGSGQLAQDGALTIEPLP